MASSPDLRVANLHRNNHTVFKRCWDQFAVKQLDLDLPAGAWFFLLRPLGCDKTTLLRMIAGFCDPTAGSLHFGDPQRLIFGHHFNDDINPLGKPPTDPRMTQTLENFLKITQMQRYTGQNT